MLIYLLKNVIRLECLALFVAVIAVVMLMFWLFYDHDPYV